MSNLAISTCQPSTANCKGRKRTAWDRLHTWHNKQQTDCQKSK